MSLSIHHMPGDTLKEEFEDLATAIEKTRKLTQRLNVMSTLCRRTTHMRVIQLRICEAGLMLETLQKILEPEL